MIGVYENETLIDEYRSTEKTSDILPVIFNKLLKQYNIKNLYYAKGPGSFMAIKITYLFLKSISIAKNMPLFATDGFNFNKNSPIKAVGTLYFIKKDDKISTQKFCDIKDKIKAFDLPKKLDKKIFNSECEPLYVLPAL